MRIFRNIAGERAECTKRHFKCKIKKLNCNASTTEIMIGRFFNGQYFD